ncbi:hypothetical protein E8K88_12035 [Lampropedia aestuarii]|uniref:Uncharacterized protein n=1 Tax=Lampropedia aestuarii TaxID=2562762 RepID=A0A4V3YWS0_9BURK|nr:hypothetical protein [Lampropedia aestuarii]THJ32422.1 hypothetical protein E8K88_12035 [Lampropedia aestuarii]
MIDSKKDSPDNFPKKKTLATRAPEKVLVPTSIGSLYARRASSSDYVSLAASSKDRLGELAVKLFVNGNKDKADKTALIDAEFELLTDEDIAAVTAAIAKANGWNISNGGGIKDLGLLAGAAMKKRNADALARQKEWLDLIDKTINPPYMKLFDEVNKFNNLVDKIDVLNNSAIRGLHEEMKSRDQIVAQINKLINPSVNGAIEELQKHTQPLSGAYSFLDADTIGRLSLSLDSIKSIGDEHRKALGPLWRSEVSEAVRNHSLNQSESAINEYLRDIPDGLQSFSNNECVLKPAKEEVDEDNEELPSLDWQNRPPIAMMRHQDSSVAVAAIETAEYVKKSAMNSEKLTLDVAELHAILIGEMIPQWMEAQEINSKKAEADRAHAEASLSATQKGLELTQNGLELTQKGLSFTRNGLIVAFVTLVVTTAMSLATAIYQYNSSKETEVINRAESQAQIELLKSQLDASQELLIEIRQLRAATEGRTLLEVDTNPPEVASNVDGLQE